MSAEGWLKAADMIRRYAATCAAPRSGVSRERIERMGILFNALAEMDLDAFRVWFDQRMAKSMGSLASLIERRGQQAETPTEVIVRMEDPEP